MSEKQLTPWDVDYWTQQIKHDRAGLMEALHPLSLKNAEHLHVALEAAFELRDWEVASHIKTHWLKWIDPNETENKSSWLKREVLHFMRGKTESKWVDLLLEAKASPVDKHGQNMLLEATREIYAQVVDFKDINRLDRYVWLCAKLLSQGANPREGEPAAIDLIDRMVGYVEKSAPDHRDDLIKIHMEMDFAVDMHLAYKEMRAEMLTALRTEDFIGIQKLMRHFTKIDEPHRTWSPFEDCLNYAKNNDRYDFTGALGALLDGGLDIAAHDYSGQTPLYLLCTNEVFLPQKRNQLVELFISMGAKPGLPNQQGYHNHATSGDAPLHACSLLEDAPVDILVSNGAPVDALDMLGLTPLLYASREARDCVIRDLLRFGASPHVMEQEGKTPAHEFMGNCISQICQVEHTAGSMAEMVLLLQSHGVDFCLMDKTGKSAWHALFSGLDWNNREEDVICMLEILENDGFDIPWRHLFEAARSCDRKEKVYSFTQKKALESATVSAGMTKKQRRI